MIVWIPGRVAHEERVDNALRGCMRMSSMGGGIVMMHVMHTVVLSVAIVSEGDVDSVDTGLCTAYGERNVIDNNHFSNKIYCKLVNPSGEVHASVIAS